ncbi:hypothetical protein [Bacteroides faecis]|uniref:hypothetical protein n=1 Tax=Bacteroides faecis TaxID=674529 RepID=UPI00286D986C|nr:hypothetical protein [Bacteroides faecis]MCS2237556.1 RagB/SusD family nutrient uptake outer membrane protein [Bacteroides faecis]
MRRQLTPSAVIKNKWKEVFIRYVFVRGLPDYPDEFYLQSGLMICVSFKNVKRMIELLGEGKRYFDIRR